jgi:hypothetical protein
MMTTERSAHNMLGLLWKKGPTRPFTHADDCKILKSDPDVQIEWSEIEGGYWEAVCVCGKEHHREPRPSGTRQDPLDPSTSMHAPQCEFKGETDRGVLRVLLKVTPKDGGYSWVECGACEHGWQSPDYAAKETSPTE